MNTRRSGGVEVWKQPAADQRQRKALVAVSNVIATGKQILRVDAVIDLDDRAIDSVRERRGERNVAAAINVTIVAVARSGPWICAQQIRNYGIYDAAVVGRCSSNVLSRRNTSRAALGPFFALAFVINEEKCLVLHDRAAERAAELVIAKWILRLASVVEIIAGIQSVVTEEIKAGAVQAVGAALGDNVDHAARAATVFGFGV